MGDNIQTNTTGRLTPCLQQKIDKTRYLVEINKTPTQRDTMADLVITGSIGEVFAQIRL